MSAFDLSLLPASATVDADGRGRDRGRRPRVAGRAVRHAALRLRRGRHPGAVPRVPRRVRRRRRVREQGVPLRRDGAARPRGGSAPRRRDRRRAVRRAGGRASRPNGSCSTATTSRRPSCAPRSRPASGASRSTRPTSSTGSRRWSATGSPAPRVHVRVTPGVEAHTHEYIETGTEDSKFGFGLDSGEALAAVQRVVGRGLLHFAGVHCHIGSQVFRLDSFERAVEKMVGLVHAIEAETGASVDELNLGGGLGVRYLPDDAPPTIEQYAAVVRDSVGKALADAGVRSRPRLLTEPGRSIVAPAGITLYTIGTIKAIDGVRTYVAVDGGMSDNLRPVTYGARYETFLPARATAERVGARHDRGQALRAGRHHRARRASARRPRDRRRARDAGHRRVRPLDGVQLQQGDAAGGRVRARRRRPARRAARDRRRPGPARHRTVPTSSVGAPALPTDFPGVSVFDRGEVDGPSISWPRDARLAAVAVAQHGVFTRAQAIDGRVRRRRRSSGGCAPVRWERVLPRVYRHASSTPVSSALSHWAAVAVGRSRLRARRTRSAAAIWRIAGRPGRSHRSSSSPTRRAPRAAGVVVHRVARLDAGDIVRVARPAGHRAGAARSSISPGVLGARVSSRSALERALARGSRHCPRGSRVRLDEIGTAGRPGAGPAPDTPRGRSVRGGSDRIRKNGGVTDVVTGRTPGLWERGRGARAPARLQRRSHHAALGRAARGRPGRRAQRRQGTRRRARGRVC